MSVAVKRSNILANMEKFQEGDAQDIVDWCKYSRVPPWDGARLNNLQILAKKFGFGHLRSCVEEHLKIVNQFWKWADAPHFPSICDLNREVLRVELKPPYGG